MMSSCLEIWSLEGSETLQKLIKKPLRKLDDVNIKEKSKKISNDQELIQSDPISCPQNQKGNN